MNRPVFAKLIAVVAFVALSTDAYAQVVDLRATILVIAKQEGGLSGDDDIAISATANSVRRGNLGTTVVYAAEDVPQWRVIGNHPIWLGTIPEGDTVDVDVRIDELDTDLAPIVGSVGRVVAGVGASAAGASALVSVGSASQFDVCSLVGGCSNKPDLIGIMRLRVTNAGGNVSVEVIPVANSRECVYSHDPIKASFNRCFVGEGATYGIIAAAYKK